MLAWNFCYRDSPARREEKEVEENPAGAHGVPGVPWRDLFRSRQLWLVMAMYWCYVWGSGFYLYHLPTYLQKGRGLTEDQLRMFMPLPFLLGPRPTWRAATWWIA